MDWLKNGSMKRMVIVWAAVVLIALVVLIVGISGSPSRSTSPRNAASTQPTAATDTRSTPTGPAIPEPTATELRSGPFVGWRAPDVTLTDLDGHRISLSSLKGKPVWINFWATWCGPCQTEMPAIKEKYDTYKGKGLQVLGINLKEDPTTIHKYIDPHGYGWTFLLDWEGFGNTAVQTYQVQAIPVNLFIDTEGVIKSMTIGPLDSMSMDMGLKTIGLK